jgi:UPF0755 protein
MIINKKTISIAGAIVLLAVIGAGIFAYSSYFGSPQNKAGIERFVIPIGESEKNIIAKLHDQGFIKSEEAFDFILTNKNLHGKMQDGGYEISKSMTAWQIADILAQEPYLKWVVIPEGLRKEQIAGILARELLWSDQQKEDWINKITDVKDDYFEGVYFPDTYLIPKDEVLADVAQRLINKFNEKFAPYADKFIKANVKWTTALKIASIIQREAAGKEDMPLIAGIIWNRLEKDMKLEIDATVQYARDNKANNGSWWTPIVPSDKQIDSPYNTYFYKGLPLHPIDNPGIQAIDAVLNSTETECLYYLHDHNGQIHCAKTYEEHKANIEKYLK